MNASQILISSCKISNHPSNLSISMSWHEGSSDYLHFTNLSYLSYRSQAQWYRYTETGMYTADAQEMVSIQCNQQVNQVNVGPWEHQRALGPAQRVREGGGERLTKKLGPEGRRVSVEEGHSDRANGLVDKGSGAGRWSPKPSKINM